MTPDLVTAFTVTGIGMLILFLALTCLYGLMYLMTAFLKDRVETGAEAQRSRDATGQSTMRQRAAVVAVALARAELELSPDGAAGGQEVGNAWRLLHRYRQLGLNLRQRRVR